MEWGCGGGGEREVERREERGEKSDEIKAEGRREEGGGNRGEQIARDKADR